MSSGVVIHEIEILEDVVISTPSPTHLMGVPHQGSPLSFSYRSKSAPSFETYPTSDIRQRAGAGGDSKTGMIRENPQKKNLLLKSNPR